MTPEQEKRCGEMWHTRPTDTFIGDYDSWREAYAAAIEREVPRWRPIETAPVDAELLLVCDNLTGFQSIVCLTADSMPMWTHWQPLPEPPKEVE